MVLVEDTPYKLETYSLIVNDSRVDTTLVIEGLQCFSVCMMIKFLSRVHVGVNANDRAGHIIP